jgi:hypothetical protein
MNAMRLDRVIRTLLAVASVTALGLAAIETHTPWALPRGEHSLANAFGIAVDAAGTIYCGIPASSAVQAYDINGRFLWSSRVDADEGMFRLRARPTGGVELATVRNHQLIELSSTGEVLSSRTDDRAYDAFGTQNEGSTSGPTSEVFRLADRSIVRVASDGQTISVVQQAMWPWALEFAIPAPIWLGFGVFWAALAALWRPEFLKGLVRIARVRWGVGNSGDDTKSGEPN